MNSYEFIVKTYIWRFIKFFSSSENWLWIISFHWVSASFYVLEIYLLCSTTTWTNMVLNYLIFSLFHEQSCWSSLHFTFSIFSGDTLGLQLQHRDHKDANRLCRYKQAKTDRLLFEPICWRSTEDCSCSFWRCERIDS